MPALSAVIITLNESRNIRRCLESLQGIADEIIVVDSGSTDDTESICRSFKVKFISREWTGYSDQKNFGNSQASHHWVFSIDADEALSPELQQSVLRVKALPEAGNYRINRQTNYCGKWIRHSGWFPDIKVRFFDRRETLWEGLIHERLNVPDEKQIPLLKGVCYHYTYYTRAEHREQAERFAALSARELMNRGRQPGLLKRHLGPPFRFFRMFFLQLGFLDGAAGYHIARISAWAVRRKYFILNELYAQRKS